MFCFGILRIYGENRKKEENWKNRGTSGSYAKAWDTLTVTRPRCQNGTPRVRCRGEGLRCGVATVHRGQNFGFLFRKSSFCTPIV